MLKRLELIGFKSFADKTRFDFAPGVTAVVGPNGSGKSNIVDAVKWILGEQSAKSLRGGEMADVIFNGSSTRKSLGMAEVTMTFDNSKRQLQFDGDEVQLTRRVYRDGQGEYLINGALSRLKDIKEMFLGSGAGQGAYSIIEQGRVDALLVASTKDRRQIFEEAAGISRFKSKKIECLRKLEKVDADLHRVRDLLQELEKTVRTLNGQAAKAQKYQEYHAQLRTQRIALGLSEYRELAETVAYEEALLAKLRVEVADATTQTATGETTVGKLDSDYARADDALREHEKRLSEARQQIAEFEAAVKSQREQAANHDAELLRTGQQRIALTIRLRTLETETTKATDEATLAAELVRAEQQRADDAATALNAVIAALAQIGKQTQADREEQFALVGRAAQWHSTAQMTGSQVERLQRDRTRKRAEGERASAEAEAIGRVLADLSQSDADVQQKLAAAKLALQELLQNQAELRRQAETLQPELDDLRERRSASRGRAEVLDGLEKNFEGIGAGVRAVLASRRQTPAILGLVADLLTVPGHVAPLVDIVLGDAAQRFVLRAGTDIDSILIELGTLPGRVGFVPLLNLDRQRDVTPLAESLLHVVSFEHPDLIGLPERLLGNVLLAIDLAHARRLLLEHPRHRIVTRTGELLEPDGTIVVGPARGESGILSRKSELRELRIQIATMDVRIAAIEGEQMQFRNRADALDAPIGGREAEIGAHAGEAGNLRERIVEQQQKQTRLTELAELVNSESMILSGEIQKAEKSWQAALLQAQEADEAALSVKLRLENADAQQRASEREREQRQAADTATQVSLTRVKQQLAGLQARSHELAGELRQRKIDALNIANTERSARNRQTENQLAILRGTGSAAVAYAEKDVRQASVREWAARRDTLRTQRDSVQSELRSVRDSWKQQQDHAHAHELTVRDLRNRRDTIAARIQDDYQIDLAAQLASHPELPQAIVGDDAQDDIEELKRKIAKLGSVNLEALEQLNVEEAREKSIRKDYDDLMGAAKSLLEIIEKINVDSRKLFNDTLNVVRVHFQDLFRKLFGGGMADIVLEDPTDVLETGIEITARPPGKELRSISLLSGGEKTLTAVALLLAMFRSKPSPFCLLDEVDAALDEANTARLAEVIKDFRSTSQFIIITHKKRTMVMADVLHGVTMQESGVSKQVATRIDDWPDEASEVKVAA